MHWCSHVSCLKEGRAAFYYCFARSDLWSWNYQGFYTFLLGSFFISFCTHLLYWYSWQELPSGLFQGHLKKWTGHSNLILPNSKPLDISSLEFQNFYNYERYDFSPNLKGVAQKLCPQRPLEVFYVFGGKSKFWAPMTLIFCAKRNFIEVNNWWKFGVDISIHFWEIQNGS